MSQNPFSALKIDDWYKLLPVIGGVTLVLALTVEMRGVPNVLVQLVSIGVIFIGIGEWINHPMQTKIVPGFKITSHIRLNTFSGNFWDLLGIGMIVYAFVYHG